MSISQHKGLVYSPEVRDKASMLALVREYRLVPFFENPIAGYSVEEHTPPEFFFSDDELGPWDWKIDCIQSGDVAYGKFLWGGKAAFATVDVYRELMNWRRAQPKYTPNAEQQKVLDYMSAQESITVPEVRKLLNAKKSVADNLLAKLQMQTRLVTGDIERVYRGADLKYSGWQRSIFCAPESLFDDLDCPFPGYKPRTLKSGLTPSESLDYLKETVRSICGDVSDNLLMKLLG